MAYGAVGTASKSKHGLVKRLGATPIDYKGEDFVERIRSLTGDGVDAAFDPIGAIISSGHLACCSAFRWLGQLTFLDDTEFDSEAIRLSLGQLEQRGPGLIIDYWHLSGGQFISWVE